MYLHTLKLWNFRKFGGAGDIVTDKNEIRKADLELRFQNGINVLIGENDSGKTATIDAIKLVLKTHSTEWISVSFDDFHGQAQHLRIECIFKGITNEEGKNFTEWLGWEVVGKDTLPYLRINLDIKHNGDRVLPFDVRAGADDVGQSLPVKARDYLKATYLKPLRDAQTELIPRKNSRLSQILEGHEAFKGKSDKHELKAISTCFDCLLQKYFDRQYKSKSCVEVDCPIESRFLQGVGNEKRIREELNEYVQKFIGDENIISKFGVVSPKLKNILESLKLTFDEEFDSGLGSQNLLFIATELINLDRSNWSGMRIGLIEELEAHLHPQAQLRVIDYLQSFIELKAAEKKDIQVILSTHSPNLGSKIPLKSIIIFADGQAYPMGEDYTELKSEGYSFLERFLDVTKANLFFAKGVIFVEGWAEELVLPALAKKVGVDLTQKGVSIVNVGGLAFLNYAKVFQRKDGKDLKIPVAVITDLDIKPDEYKQIIADEKTEKDYVVAGEIQAKKDRYSGQAVQTFVSPRWTFEYCVACSLIFQKLFYKAVLQAFKEQKNYQREAERKKIDDAILNIDTAFNKWADKEIPFKIYRQILGEDTILDLCKEKLSKTIIAQCFARLLKDDTKITKQMISEDKYLGYLINAIHYAVGENVANTDK